MTRPRIETVVRGLAGDRDVRLDGPWLVVRPPSAPAIEHGWKLHVSARAATFPGLVATLVPVLLAEGCVFKLARSVPVLAELNDGVTAPASVGKAVTIYPSQDRVRELGLALATLLRGHDGPRVAGDRRVTDTAPVYYRYGPFTAGWRAGSSGRVGLVIQGPDGEEFDGAAAGRGYRQPSWARDPFPDAVGADMGLLLGGRYAVTEGIVASGRGDVYRAVDRETGRTVVVKQARALVAESPGAVDTRARLRNERRILHVLDGVAGVPRFADHFRHADDEYLVLTDEGPTDLRTDLRDHGPYRLDDGPRSARRLARDLATILRDVHARGVVVRDVKPGNIIVPAVTIVDFGVAAYEGVHPAGGSPGYAPAWQDRPRPADDLYALGMTLVEALTGLPPLHGASAALARTKALETVRSRWGTTPAGLVGAVADLLHDDPAVAESAAARLRTGTDDRVCRDVLPPAPAADSMAELTGVLLDRLLTRLDTGTPRAKPNPTLYTGPAGVGMELLRHDDQPGVRPWLTRLVEQASAEADAVDLGPGLLAGRTGVDMFVRAARDRLGLPLADRRRPDVSGDFDLVSGTVGIGLGHVWFLRRDGDPADRAVVAACAEALAEVAPERPGLAHGLAGVVLFDLYAADHVDPAVARARLNALVEAAPPLIARARAGEGTELRTASWCNGLTGVARVLAEAGVRGDRPDCVRLAMAAGDALAGWVPRSVNLGQCCGVAGIGDLFLRLAVLPGGARFADHAMAAARHLLLRSAGTGPVSFSADDKDGVSWAVGLSGLLGFVRRLRDNLPG